MYHYLSNLESAIKGNWERTALANFRGEQFTFCDLASNIAKFHILFEKAGIKEGDRIAVCARNSARWAISFLAANTYGAVVVPILNDFLPSSIAHLVNHSECSVLFTDQEIWSKFDSAATPALKVVINCNDFTLLHATDASLRDHFARLPEEFNSRFPLGFSRENVNFPTDNRDKLAIINYTSGTTSAPKGVMLTYGNMSSTIEFCQKYVHNTPEDKIVSMLPLAHMYGLAVEFLFSCCSGCGITFLGKTPSPTLLLKALQEVKPYMVVSVPLVMEKIYKSNIKPIISKWPTKAALAIPLINTIIYRKIRRKLMDSFGGNVRLFIMGGAALNPAAERCFKHLKLPYTVGYGMTEACPLLTWETPEKYAAGSCGKACHQIRIDSEDPLHIAGEIQAKGPNIFLGYLNNPEADEMAFTKDGWLRTGDLGIFDSKGNLYIKGRSKSMILSANGQNIYPEELEAVVNNQPYISESVVVDRAGKIVALVYLDKEAIRKDKLDDETVSDIPERSRINANRLLPAYSQIAKVEIVLVPFEKTPKMSIKRFLYK